MAEDEDQVNALVEATQKAFERMKAMGAENSAVMFVVPVTEMHRFNTG